MTTMVMAIVVAAATAADDPAPAKPAPAKAPAAAPAPKPPAAPKAPAELDALFKGYLGAWSCDTTYPAGSTSPGSIETKLRSTVRFRKDLGGMWYRADYETPRTKTTPTFRSQFWLGYDAVMKAALLTGIDSMGGMSDGVAVGAAGDTVSFVGDAVTMGQRVKARETFVRRGPRELEHRYEMDRGAGFQVMVNEVCKKSAAAPAADAPAAP